jgi:hypothetical protein
MFEFFKPSKKEVLELDGLATETKQESGENLHDYVFELINSASFRDNFTSALEEEGRDLDGRLVKVGESVVVDPESPEVFLSDDADNRKRFVLNNFSVKGLGTEDTPGHVKTIQELQGYYGIAIDKRKKTLEDIDAIPSQCFGKLEKEARDVEGKLLGSGTNVLFDIRTIEGDQPLFLENTLENRVRFVKNSFKLG